MFFLCNKYSPKKIIDININKQKYDEISKFLSDFRSKKTKKNTIVVYGGIGTGKTHNLNIIINELGFDMCEVNPSNFKGMKQFKVLVEQITKSTNINIMFCKPKMTVLIIDEFDTLCSIEKNLMSEVSSLINIEKKKLYTNIPIIFVCNSILTKKIRDLNKVCTFVNIPNPNNYDLTLLSSIINKGENLGLNDIMIQYIIDKIQHDFRKFYEIYETILLYKHEKITLKRIKNILENINDKEFDLATIESCDKIFNNKELTYEDLHLYYDTDKIILPLIVYENMYDYLGKSTLSNEEKISNLHKTTKSICNSNIFESVIFNEQRWALTSVVSNMAVFLPYHVIKNTSNKNYFNVKYTVILSKISLKYYNIKIIKTLCQKMNINIAHFYSIAYFLFNIIEKTDINNCDINYFNLTNIRVEKTCKMLLSITEQKLHESKLKPKIKNLPKE